MQTLGSAVQRITGALGGSRGQQPPGGPGGPDEPKYADDYVSFVDKEFSRRQKERLPLELTWRLLLSFLEGNQNIQINPAASTLEETPLLTESEERKVFNQLAPILEARVARLVRVRPIRKVRPASNEARDISCAQTSAKLIQWVEQETNQREQVSEAVLWMESTGTVFKFNAWNPESGNVLGVVQEADAADQPTGQTVEIHEGDVDPQVVSPFEIYPDNLCQSFRRQRSIIHARAYHVDEIFELWGVQVPAEPCDSFTLQSQNQTLFPTNRTQLVYGLKTTRLEKHAVVKQYMERPTKKHPEGRLITVANRMLLHAGPLPFRVGKRNRPDIPLVPAYSIKQPGRFFGDCPYRRLIDVQRSYNALRNRRHEYLRRAAIGQPVVEEDSLANEDEIRYYATDPGQMWIVRKGTQRDPRYMEFPDLPTAFDREIQDCLQEFRALSGVSDLAKMSDAPVGVKSGVALRLAMEQDETRLSTTAGHIEEALIEEGKQWLRLYKQFVQGPRIARIASRSTVEVLEWTASDIRSDDVIVEGGSGLVESPAQREQRVFDLLESGLLNDPETGKLTRDGRRKVLEMLEMGHWESAADTDYELQVAKAERQVKAIKAGFLPQTAPFDDPIIHLQVLRRWMLSSEFEETAAQDMRIQVAAYQYEATLRQMLQQQVMAQAAMQAQAAPPQQMPGQMPPPTQAAMPMQPMM